MTVTNRSLLLARLGDVGFKPTTDLTNTSQDVVDLLSDVLALHEYRPAGDILIYHQDSEKVSTHFRWIEFDCKCGCIIPTAYWGHVHRLAENLEVLRKAAGHKPLLITSGYRCWNHHKAIYERLGQRPTTKSLHLTAEAVDVRHPEMTGKQLAEIAETEIHAGRMHNGGLGIYSDRRSILHYDVRRNGMGARWGF